MDRIIPQHRRAAPTRFFGLLRHHLIGYKKAA
jgi:hypothetical protein